MGADAAGMFFYPKTAAQFVAGNLQSMPCRWCNETITLMYPLRLFLCSKCDRPGSRSDTIPEGFNG